MHTNWFICLLAICVCLTDTQTIHTRDGEEDRDRRSVQSLFDGLIDAITQKHGRSTKPTNILPKASALKSTTTATFAPLKQVKAPEKSTTPINLIDGMTILARSDDVVNEIDDGGSISTTSLASDAINSTDALDGPFITPPTILNDMITAPSDAPQPNTSAQAIRQALPEKRANQKEDIEAIPPEPKQNQPARVLSGRYTQYWGNPLFFQSQYSPLYPFGPYYNDIDYNTVDVGPQLVPALPLRPLRRQPPPFVPVPVPPFHPYGPFHLPGLARPVPAPLPPPAPLPQPPLPPNYRPIYYSPLPNSPVFIVPAPPVIIPRHSDQSHSHVKMHDAGYDQYIYHENPSSTPHIEPIAQPTAAADAIDVEHRENAAQENIHRQTHIDLYANLDNGQNLLAAQSKVSPQIQWPSPRATKTKTPNNSQQRVQNQVQKPYLAVKDKQLAAGQAQSEQYQRSSGQRSMAAPTAPQTYLTQSTPHLLPQSHVQYFGHH